MVLMKRATSTTSNSDESEKAKRNLTYGDGSNRTYSFPPTMNDDDVISGRQTSFTNSNVHISKSRGTKLSGGKSSICTWFILLLKGVVVIGTIVFAINTYMELNGRKMELGELKADFQKLEIAAAEVEAELASASMYFKRLQDSIVSPDDEGPDLEKEKITTDILTRQDALSKRTEALQQEVKRLHYEHAIDKFGHGPHFVQFEVILDNRREYFEVEMAPLDVMPHAVNVFLNMVVSGLWNDSVFLHRANHLIQAIPIDSEGNEKRQHFNRDHLQMSFPEYESSYPHLQYTLGFSGRPGGPEFYISTTDNAYFHGPGGQPQYELPYDADPCFGKVVKGHAVIDKMQQLNEIASQKIRDGNEEDVMFTALERIALVGR